MLNTEEDVLVELADPTPFSRSPATVSRSSEAGALLCDWTETCDIPFTVAAESFSRAGAVGTAVDDGAREFSSIHGDLGRFRVCAALERFCATTEGAVGKKSAKPFEERDMA